MEIQERDWKVLRDLKQIALDRFCAQVLDECTRIIQNERLGAHDRYRRVYEITRERDRKLADTFDGLRRSNAFFALMAIRHQGLLTQDEFDRFSPELRDRIDGALSL
ncbi:peptide ABC transporter substrate-binding protein [Longimicrobium terrae]|uniref:Peptide ABC transporter substrate-binding protein n=1 Tax=Longimicrobium terrae TaxID=1639882 RepID=A0A841H3T4_9BACT|nr:peptide ABC transporter substrate-binding protein [Longimicrobium terrae]MBB4638294.1 hypothetical protein [Longimicrobium terrae]MBB6072638.1 hypothetical protein [Longimicrobium terrae]NNC28583.1 peptide ABC transporter substrate-binding protein [Longimicrobium terrae]